jgi:DNA replication and repair protein RecF
MRLLRLTLTDFRNYEALSWRPSAPISVLYGPNGSGKTNLLEAVSLLSPGRGLRGARNAELLRQGAEGGWAVAGRFITSEGEISIGTGSAAPAVQASRAASGHERRVFRLDGAAPRSQAEIAARSAAVWLTPQMDRLFQEGLSGRRRFFDRLVMAVEPSHAREMAAHESALTSRNRLLAEGRQEPAWLAGLEDAIARHAVAASAARNALIGRLNATLAAGVAGSFPAARVGLQCPIAERLSEQPALMVEEWLRAGLEANRARDAAAGGALLGAHRSDLMLEDARTGVKAALASTGEQWALLVGIVLAHALLVSESRGFPPLLLLDEPLVHLDRARRSALFDALVRLPTQTIMTGTDVDTFFPLSDHAEALRISGNSLQPDERFSGSIRKLPSVTSTL